MFLHLLVLSMLHLEATSDQSRIYDLRAGTQVPLKALADELACRDVVFLGEEHGNPAGHRLQLEIIEQLHRQQPDLVISMEMFERDVQPVLDDYLRGRIDEEQFLALARPWANYESHYRPIVEFARKQQLDVLAANVPREAAQAVSRGASPSRQHQAFLPRETTAPKDAYWERFVETMEGHVGTEESDAMERFYQAQCLKDDAMAETITDYIRGRSHRQPLVVHLGGRFHSDYGYGTVSRVLSRQPLAQVAVVSMESVEEWEDFQPGDHREQGHFLLAVPPHAPPQITEKEHESEMTEASRGAENSHDELTMFRRFNNPGSCRPRLGCSCACQRCITAIGVGFARIDNVLHQISVWSDAQG